jgi:LCP family protein required for cell wall assembly
VPGVLKLVAMAAAVALVSTVSIAAIAVNTLTTKVSENTVSLGNEAAVQDLVEVGAIEGDVNVLIVGSDTRIDQMTTDGDDTEGARNDVTMLLHVSKDHQNVSVLSFPRDAMVDMAECTDPDTKDIYPAVSYQQLNTALSRGGQRGGLGCVVATVQEITGLVIPFAAVISFDGVAAMTSAIGGVDVCVSESINDPYSNLHLNAGTHTLAGDEALAFLRTREGVGDGSDLARISSQQVYLSALTRKILSDGTLTNVVTLYSLANAALSNMLFSTELGKADSMVSIARALQGVQLDKVAFLRYPVVEDPNDRNRVVIDDSNAELLNTALINDTSLDLTAVKPADSVVPADGTVPPETPTEAGVDPSTTAAPEVPGTTVLPDSFTGQTAADVTCSVGN